MAFRSPDGDRQLAKPACPTESLCASTGLVQRARIFLVESTVARLQPLGAFFPIFSLATKCDEKVS
ncbi:hypothetical protein [Fischerella sp. PCC 9605]|uniref:hypothetical protein n=1 Tax=Fischerella sp. PCC 9605 TaxID=1173024 RepID=UPI0012DC2C4D|nr:hypothetical protein [Fischerella sp. PCC 9605]